MRAFAAAIAGGSEPNIAKKISNPNRDTLNQILDFFLRPKSVSSLGSSVAIAAFAINL
jgi:hypothetical protein